MRCLRFMALLAASGAALGSSARAEPVAVASPPPVVATKPIAKLEPAGMLKRPAALRPRALLPPATPKGLPQCKDVLPAPRELPRAVGETIRYQVDINGLSVGVIDFKIERHGTYDGKPVTEYRSLFKVDSLVSNFVPMEGRAAALVPAGATSPSMAMSTYLIQGNNIEELMAYDQDGSRVQSTRKRNGLSKDERRTFATPVRDFLSSFYVLRTFPRDVSGCTIIYGNQRAYTVWIRPDGSEEISTPVGRRPADRYVVRYASDKSKEPFSARVWLSQGADRVPYQAEVQAKGDALAAHIHLFEPGR